MNSLALLIDRWRTQNQRLLPPEPKRRVEATFARFGVQPSDQVVQMYSCEAALDGRCRRGRKGRAMSGAAFMFGIRSE